MKSYKSYPTQATLSMYTNFRNCSTLIVDLPEPTIRYSITEATEMLISTLMIISLLDIVFWLIMLVGTGFLHLRLSQLNMNSG